MKQVIMGLMFILCVGLSVNAQTTVSAVSPAKHALNVSVSASIQVTFSSAMLPSSFNDTTSFIVSGMTSGRHRGTIVLSSSNTIATFTPTVAFAKGEIITVDLTSNLQDAGNNAITPFVYSFVVNVNTSSRTFATEVSYGTGSTPRAVFISDIDGDGDGDIITANEGADSVSVLKNNGNGTFASKIHYAAGTNPYAVCISDLDNDGDGDVAVTNIGTISIAPSISILKNNGDGTFAAKTDYETGNLNVPYSSAVGDIDGDGDGDIAITNYGANTVSILKNNGDATLVAKVDYTVGNFPRSVFTSDMDGDGDGDLAVANSSGNSISILKNNGDGTFAAKVDYVILGGSTSIFISDVDGDGDGDLAATSTSSDSVSILKNNGDGTFAAKVNYATGVVPYSLFISDVDGDGDGDIAVANATPGTVSILKNIGDGTFTTKVDYSTGANPLSLFVSDVDGDGICDIVTANGIEDKVFILKGQNGPSVTTTAASNISFPTVTANGTVNANNASTTVRFVYGTVSGTYTDSVTAAENPVSGTTDTPVSGTLSGLSPSTTYYFRAATSNSDGYIRGEELSFTTLNSAVPSATTTVASNIGVATARANGTVNAKNASTTIRFLYGTVSGTYTDSVTAAQSPVSGTTNTSVTGSLTGLTANTTYYFRVAASNANGYVRGSELSFTSDSTASASGYALQFDGVNDFVYMGNKSAFSVGTAVTYEAWINPSSAQTGWILNKWTNFLEDKQIIFSGDRVYFYLHNAFGGTQLQSSSISLNQFTHIAATYNGSIAKLYINGVLDATKSVSSGVSNSTGGFYVGYNAERGDGQHPFQGIIDEVRIWNTARTESEIQAAMNSPLTGGETGLVAYWNFDEGSGTSTADLTVNSNDGTISGATWVASGVALPVELTSFTAQAKQNGIELKWKTATEVNNYGFEIEKSRIQNTEVRSQNKADAWDKVGFVEGSGTTNSPKQYSFSDKNLSAGKYSYRLKQIDRDGKFSHSQEVEVEIGSLPNEFALMQNYPNPFNPSTVISYQLPVNGHVSLKVYDAIGREVTTLVNEIKEAGVYFVQFDVHKLASGLYFAKMQQGEKHQIIKMVLMK